MHVVLLHRNGARRENKCIKKNTHTHTQMCGCVCKNTSEL